MMRHDKNYSESVQRICPICGTDALDFLKEIRETTIGIKWNHNLWVKLSVCKKCGFVFSSPSISQKELNEYYNDSLPFFNPEEDYSVEKRIQFLLKFLNKGDCVAEIGGNTQGKFREELQNCAQYYSFDINLKCKNTVDNLKDIPKVDVLMSYYVFEHLVNLNELIQEYREHLFDQGRFIIEVPDANMYYRDSTCLAVAEHVNHFTPHTLSMLMQINGFELIGISRKYASRNYGFVAAYKKVEGTVERNTLHNEYIINKALIEEGLEIICDYETNLNNTCEKVHKILSDNSSCGRATAFWCAGVFFEKLYRAYTYKFHQFDGVIIDENPHKKMLGLEYDIVNLKEIVEDGTMQEIKSLIVCSHTRLKSILETVKEHRDITGMDIYIITPEYLMKLVNK